MELPSTWPASSSLSTTPGAMIVRAAIGQAHDLPEQASDVFVVVKRLHRLHVEPVAFDQFLDVVRVGLLDHGRVEQHGRAQVARGRRRSRPARGSRVCAEQRQQPRVIDVRVRKHDGVDLVHGHLQRAVALVRFLAAALETSRSRARPRLSRCAGCVSSP